MVTSKVYTKNATQVIRMPQDAFREIFRKPLPDTSSKTSIGSGAVDPHLYGEVEIINSIYIFLRKETEKITWSEDVTERVNILTLVSEYRKGNIIPSEEAEKRLEKLFDKVAESPPFDSVEETMKWLRG